MVVNKAAPSSLPAALINRINEERLYKNKGPVGFINEVLYSHPSVLDDITAGSNTGCQEGDDGDDLGEGFKAVPGYDTSTR